ncbi:MAG TPA: YadA-like family protein, partial [Pseudoxanthomonas sp.]|nr:YadA-like family protein [Pseudoxanthomonas sp.]
FGDTAVANNAGDVALGSGSVTDVAVATPSTIINGTTYNFAGTNPTSTVSVGAAGAERTITNVAAGRISGTSTDAINGSQLFATNQAVEAAAATANAGWNITDGTNSGNIAPSETLTMAAGSNATVTYDDTTSTLTVGVVADPSFNSVTVGDTVINDGSISFTSGGPSITNVGIDAGNTTITNVAAAVNNTDAVNLEQVTNLVDGVATHYYSVNDNGVQGGNYNNDGATGINALAAGVGASAAGAQGVALGNSASVTIDGGVALGSGSLSNRVVAPESGNIIAGTGLVPYNTTDKALLGAVSVGTDTSYRQITNVADGTQAQDAVTVRQLQGAVGSLSATGTRYFHANSVAPDSVAAGAESIAVGPTTVVNGDNGIGMGNGALVQQTAPGGIAIGQNSEVSFADGIALGTNAASNGIQALALGAGSTANEPGSVALGAGSGTDVAVATPSTIINGATYNFAGSNPTSTVSVGVVGGERTITNVAAGRISDSSTDAINGSQLYSTHQAIEAVAAAANTGWNISAEGANASNVAPGEVVDLNNSDGNIVVSKDATSDNVTFDLADDITVDSVTAGGTVLNNNGLTIVGGPSVTVAGVNAGGLVISNVAPGVAGTDAVNVDQLTAVGNVANAGWNITDGTNSGNIGPNETLTVAAGSNATVAYDDSTGTMTVGVVANPSFTSIVVGNTLIDNSGLTITGGPSITNVGIDAGNTTITNVGPAINGGDAVNLDQVTNLVDGATTRYYSVNDNGVQGGNYNNDGATGINAMAAGVGASSSAAQGVALGNNASVTTDGGVALGAGSLSDRAVAPASGNIIAGTGLVPYNTTDKTLLGAVSVGTDTTYRQITNVADGTEDQDAVTLRQLRNGLSSFAVTPTMYFHANSTADDSLAVGAESVAIGPRTVVNGDNGIGMGNGALVQQTAPGGIAIGQSSTVSFADGVALGTNAVSNGIQSLALGAGATANEPGSVALGAGSVTAVAVATPTATINGVTYTFAGTTPTSTISVGAVGAERTITNVAAGRISASSTDAVNGSQLFATHQAIENLATAVNASATHYYSVNDGGVQGGNYNNDGATATGAIASGVNASATATDAIAIGTGATAGTANSVALGAGSVTAAAVGTASATIAGTTYNFAGAAPTGTVSVGNAGAERTVTNVAAGRISDTSTDAINGSQLNATNRAVNQLDGRVTNLESSITNIVNNGSSPSFQVGGDNTTVATASGDNSTAGGSNAVASGNNSTAIGGNSTASADNSTALGNGATVTHGNSVALGSGSATTVGAQNNYNAAYVGGSSSTGEVNVGGRTITGVAPGIAGTDAVNVNQLNAGVDHAITTANQYTDSRLAQLDNDVWTLERGYRGATSAAMAMSGLPQAYLPGKSMLAVGFGGYQGEYGMAVGLSGITDNGRWVYKASASGNTTRDWGFSVGAGIQW